MANKRPAAASSASEAKAGPAVPQAAPAANSEQEIDELRGPPNTLHTMPDNHWQCRGCGGWMRDPEDRVCKFCPQGGGWPDIDAWWTCFRCGEWVPRPATFVLPDDPSTICPWCNEGAPLPPAAPPTYFTWAMVPPWLGADNDNDGDMDVDGNGTGDGNMDEDGDGNMDEDALFLPLDKKPRTK